MSLEEEEVIGAALITKVERQRRNRHRYNIFIADEFAFSVHEDMLIKHKLLKGEFIAVEQVHSVLQDEERYEAYMKALRWIGRRPHSMKELRVKLNQSGFETPVITNTLETLIEQNYVNDEEFAKQWTEHRIVGQRKGRNVVRQELQQKGLSKDHIQEAINEINPEEEYLGALSTAKKKWGQTKGTLLERKRKTAAFLMRRGYTSSMTGKVLQEVAQGHHDESEEDWEEETWSDN
jgi:regulatory protein